VSALLRPAKIEARAFVTLEISGECRVRALSFAVAFISRCRRLPWQHHLSLDHHGGKLSVWAVYRGLHDDHAPPHMDRHSNTGQPPWHAGAKDIRLRFDRGCPKPRRDVEPGQPSAEIIGERRQSTAMHMAAVVEMTVVDIEFADQLIPVGVGNADAEVFRHTGMGGGRDHRRAPIRGKNIGRPYSILNRHGVVDMTLMAALMWRMGGIGPMPHQLSHFLTVKNEADRRYGIERYLKEPVVFTACSTKGSASRSPIWCLEARSLLP
jgi:hypothetical protein